MYVTQALCAAALLALPAFDPSVTIATSAGDGPYVVAVSDLDFEGDPPNLRSTFWLRSPSGPAVLPRIALEGGVARLGTPPVRNGVLRGTEIAASTIALDVEASDQPLRGTLYLPSTDATAMEAFRFTIDAASVREDAQAHRQALASHYGALRDAGLPGAAWFRQRARALGSADSVDPWTRRGGAGDADTFAMFTGGRAVSENLRLDEVVSGADAEEEPTIPIESIDGVRVPEMEWGALVAGLEPKIDSLASAIPADQHAVFFPSFSAFVRVADQLADESRPFVQLADGRAQDALVRERYEKQLCLSLDAFTRRLGGAVIRSVAITGSDPYLRTGSDVALLLEGEAAAIGEILAARMEAAGARSESVEVIGSPAFHVWADDRSIDAWLCVHDGLAIVSNSRVQLERILRTIRELEPSLAVLPETRFFRDRYPLGDEGEDAFVLVSDAAIRRWAGPKWRIASARRTRAAAVLAERDAWRLAGELGAERGPDGGGPVVDPVHGTRRFLTPIAELEIEAVSAAEKAGYEQWRRGYEASWGAAFDPLAVRIGTREDGLDVDLSILPLTVRSEYSWMSDLAGDARIPEGAGDPHDGTIVHWVAAIDHEGDVYRRLRRTLGGVGPNGELGLDWVGDHVALWLDEDPGYFARVADADSYDVLTEEFLPELPFGLYIDVSSPLGLAGFLTALRGFAEDAAPGLLEYETREHGESKYVAILVSDEFGFDETPTIYYAVLPGALCLSFSEGVVQRAIERGKAPVDDASLGDTWAGRSLALSLGGAFRDAIAAEIVDIAVRDRLRARSWMNLPILNDYRRHGIADPVAFHERRWGARVVCPGGGEYVWNESAGTMESTVYGHPAEALEGPLLPPALEALRRLDFGLDFETFRVEPPDPREERGRQAPDAGTARGLRARARLRR